MFLMMHTREGTAIVTHQEKVTKYKLAQVTGRTSSPCEIFENLSHTAPVRKTF